MLKFRDQLIYMIPYTSNLCEVSRCKKYTPYIVNTVINFIISQIQTDSLLDRFFCDQLFNFISGSCISFINKTFYKIISTAVDPIGFRLCLRIIDQIKYIIDHIPRAVNSYISETISIIPFPGLLKMIL